MATDDPDPTCKACKRPLSWHDESDQRCPDDDGPHPYSEAAYINEAQTTKP